MNLPDGFKVSDRGLVYAPRVQSTYGDTVVEVHTSSAAGPYIWLNIIEGYKVYEEGLEGNAHMTLEQAEELHGYLGVIIDVQKIEEDEDNWLDEEEEGS
jgi:hypothetical protein